MTTRWQKIATHCAVVGFYIVLTLIFTYPLVTHFNTHILGDGFDSNQFPIGFWWVNKAITELHVNPLHTDYLFYPFGTSLVFHTMTFLNGLLSIPLQQLVGLTAAVNLFTLATFIVSAYGTFLLVKYLTANNYAAFLSGFIFGFCPYRLANGMGFYHTLNTQWIPFYVLFLMKLCREKSWKNGMWAGVFLLLTALNSYNYLIFLTMFTLFYPGYLSWTERRIVNRQLFIRLALCAGIFLIGFAPVLHEAFGEITRYGDYLGSDVIGTDILHFLIPSIFHPLFGQTAFDLTASLTSCIPLTIVYVGYTVLLSACYAAIALRKQRDMQPAFWLWSSAIFFLFALGPFLQFNGQTLFSLGRFSFSIPLPHWLLLKIPILGGVRISARFSVMLMLSMAVLSGYACIALSRTVSIFSRHNWKWLPGVMLFVLIGFEYLNFPYPNLCDQSVSPIYHEIAQDSGDFSILQMPLQFKSGNTILTVGSSDLDLAQTIHQKRLIGGYVARVPHQLMRYFEQVPILSTLIRIQQGQAVSPEQVATDKQYAETFIRFFGLKYLVIHEHDRIWIGFFMRPDNREILQRMRDYLTAVFPLEQFRQDGVVTAYTLLSDDREANPSIQVDFGTPAARFHLGYGWSADEPWEQDTHGNRMVQTHAMLLLRSEVAGTYRCQLRVAPFYRRLVPQQRMEIGLNGHLIHQSVLKSAWNTLTFKLPSSVMKTGINRLTFAYHTDPGWQERLRIADPLKPYVKFESLECAMEKKE